MSKFLNIKGIIINKKHIVTVTYANYSKVVITCVNRVISVTSDNITITNGNEVRFTRDCIIDTDSLMRRIRKELKIKNTDSIDDAKEDASDE